MTITLQPKASPGHPHYRTGFGTSEWRHSSWHKHLYAQLLYPAEGVVRIWAGEKRLASACQQRALAAPTNAA